MVTDQSGAPIELANLTARPVDVDAPTGPVTQEANVTDVDGRFFVPLPPGTWHLEAEAPGYLPATQLVVVVGNAPATQHLVLGPRVTG